MKIVVCVKQVPDSAAKVVVEDGRITWGDAPLVINPWDEFAVEAALMQQETLGGDVIALSIGGESAKEALICEILKDDGTMARLPDLMEFGAAHGIKLGTIAELIHFRSQNESLVKRVTERTIETAHGPFRLIAFVEKLSNATHLALVRGEVDPKGETLVRVHEPLSVLDLLDAGPSSHSWSLNEALARIAAEGRGASSVGQHGPARLRRSGPCLPPSGASEGRSATMNGTSTSAPRAKRGWIPSRWEMFSLFAMECVEKGIVTREDLEGIDLTWGNAEGMLSMLERIINRDGFGDVLADGVRMAAQKIGKGSEECAMHVGGQEPGMHNALFLPGRGTGYVCDPTPGRHTTGAALTRLDIGAASLGPYPELQFPNFGRYEFKAKGPASAAASCYWQVATCAGLCLFPVVFGANYPVIEFLNAVTGWDMNIKEALESGARIQTLRQAIKPVAWACGPWSPQW